MRIAVIGARGHVGNALFQTLSTKKTLQVTAVTRENYHYWRKKQFDIVINSAMPSARFWAQNHPQEDYIETVKKTADIVYGWSYKKIIQVSTVSARMELDHVYGRHKKAAEVLCSFGDNLIVRLTSIYADTLKKGALIDIIEKRKVFVHENSRYGFTSLSFVASWIAKNLRGSGLEEVGARNSLSLKEIADYFNIPIAFEGRVDIQEVQKPSKDFPDAREVLYFLEKKIQK